MRIRNLVSFPVSRQKYENVHFVGLLLYKAYKIVDGKYWRVMSHDYEDDAKFEEKLTLGSKNEFGKCQC